MKVTIYSKTVCPNCTATKKFLTKRGVEFEEINMDSNPQAYEYVMELGFAQAPVVVAGDKMWSGLRPDLMRELV